MSYPPLYPQIDPQEVAQAHQFNVTHQPPQSQHNFVHQTSPYLPTANAYPTDQIYPPTSTQFVSGHFYAPSHSNQVPQYYYYQPQQMTVQSNAQTLQYHPQPTPVQTSFPHLYSTQTSQPTSVQTTVAPQTQPPVSHNITTHTNPHVHHQEHFKPIEEAHPPQQLSDEEEEDEETTSSIITTDRKLARLLSRVERTLKRLQISIIKRNRTGTARSKELLENYITELQAFHIADAEERAQVNILIERIHLSIKHAGEELELMEQDRQRNLTQYRNAVLELKKEAQQAQQLLESDLDQQTQDIINQVHQQQRQT